jgi:phosphoribosyl-ATP pyrophosphohydrolase
MSNIIDELTEILEQRKTASTKESYVANLHAQGINKILEKVGEEAIETIIAAKDHDKTIDQSREAVIHETADLWFHTMVMLSHLDLEPRKVLEELEKRFNISGLEEKAARQN